MKHCHYNHEGKSINKPSGCYIIDITKEHNRFNVYWSSPDWCAISEGNVVKNDDILISVYELKQSSNPLDILLDEFKLDETEARYLLKIINEPVSV